MAKVREVDEICGYLTIAAAMRESGYSHTGVQRLASTGKVAALRIADITLIKRSSLAKYLRRRQALRDVMDQERLVDVQDV